jgi:DNA-binding NarL/FixJ family response regulator
MTRKSNPPSQMRIMTPILRVLVVDDDPLMVRSIKRYVATRRGHWQVLGFIDPREAEREFAEHRFDVVVTDYEMPHKNGIELLQVVERVDPSSLRIVISGRERASVEAFPETLVHAWIKKQGDVEPLVLAIDELMQARVPAERRVQST